MKRLTNDEFLKKLQSRYNNEYIPLSDYISGKTKMKFKHTCGHEFEMRPEDILKGQQCPKCAVENRRLNKMKYTTGSFKDVIPDDYEVLGEYNGLHKPILMRHLICGIEFSCQPYNFLNGTRCPKCSHGHEIKSQEDFEKEISEIDPSYQIIGKYTGATKPVLAKHLTCGHEFNLYPDNFIYKGMRCPFCACKPQSNPENELYEFIKSIYSGEVIHGFREYEENRRKFVEIDIYIPEMKLGFEFNGLYWHSDLRKDKMYHYNKMKYFENKGIHLIQIFEDEWNYQNIEVKNFIQCLFGLENSNFRFDGKNFESMLFAVPIENNQIKVKFIDSKFLNYILSQELSGVDILIDLGTFSPENINYIELLPPDFQYYIPGSTKRTSDYSEKSTKVWDCGHILIKK